MVNWLTMLVSITQIPVSIGQSDNFKISSGTIQKLSSMMTTMTERRHRSTKTRQRNGTTSPMTMEAPTRRATIPRRRALTTTTASTSPSRHLPTRRMKRQKRAAGKSWAEHARRWRAVVGGERLRQRRGPRQRGTTGSTRGRARRSARRT